MTLAAAIMLSALFAGGNLAYAEKGSRGKDAVQKDSNTDPNGKLKESVLKGLNGDPKAKEKLAALDVRLKAAKTPRARESALAEWHHNYNRSSLFETSREFASKAMKESGEKLPTEKERREDLSRHQTQEMQREIEERADKEAETARHKAPPEAGQPKDAN